MWLYGGNEYNAGGAGKLNDLLQLLATLGGWRWQNGSRTTEMVGIFGAETVSKSRNQVVVKTSMNTWLQQDVSGSLSLLMLGNDG